VGCDIYKSGSTASAMFAKLDSARAFTSYEPAEPMLLVPARSHLPLLPHCKLYSINTTKLSAW